MLKVWGRVNSINVQKVLWALEELKVPYERVDAGMAFGVVNEPFYKKMNPNSRVPTIDDDGFVLWESNAILFYMAVKRPDTGLWPSDLKGQADVLRWLAWESAHWDAESCGMVAYEKAAKAVLGLGPPDPAFIARGEQNFDRFAAVLNNSLRGKTWLIADQLTIADFSIAAWVPSAERMELPVGKFTEILRWYKGLAALPAWCDALAAKDAAMADWISKRVG